MPLLKAKPRLRLWLMNVKKPQQIPRREPMKKLRALLRLVRHGMPDVQPAENVILRDAARLLSGRRDAAVRLATYDRLIGADPAPALLALRAHLVAEAAMPAAAPPDLHSLFDALAQRIEGWTLAGSDRRILAEGLADTRARARRGARSPRRRSGPAPDTGPCACRSGGRARRRVSHH